jgi:hypothetical protein
LTRLLDQLLGLLVGIESECLLHLPLVQDKGQVGLTDAVVRAPGVLAVKQHVAPGLLERGRREGARVANGPERLGLDETLGGGTVEGGFKR